MKKLTALLILLPLAILLSGWGYKGHRIINQNMAACLPAQLGFLKPNWTNFVTSHASDPDNRRDTDPDEGPRHYLDIDNYPEFVATGRIPETYDSVVTAHGEGWVIDQGILPWATMRTYDSLKSAFTRGDWNASEQFAADLGHYVADGHMPLHITNNYDGQMTGQNGIHSRYESKMISNYESLLVYPPDSTQFISDIKDYIFSYLYDNHRYVDSVLLADTYAKTQSGGSVSGTVYYQALWDKTGAFTIALFRNATGVLSNLIYTAWVEAGSPLFFPNGISEPEDISKPRFTGNFPNPFTGCTTISFEVPVNNTPVTLRVFDESGNLTGTLLDETLDDGNHKVKWDGSGMARGTYLCVLTSRNYSATLKLVLVK
jgi:hypothetical protein